MAFTTQERVNATAKALLGGVLDADPTAQWYESVMPFGFVLPGTQVWTQADIVKLHPAANLAAAQANCAGPLVGIVADISAPVNAVRLTPLASVNNTFAALSVFGDWSSALLDNWLKPSFVRQLNGNPSNGYAMRLYNGNPNAGGTEVLTTAGTTGTGVNKSVGWVFNYDNGLLLLSSDFSVADPWILGFRYIGETAGSGGGGPCAPAMSTASRIAYVPTTDGILVYDTDLGRLYVWQAPFWIEV